jgi:hypothetical protein
MKATLVALWLVTLAAAYGLGYSAAPGSGSADLSSIDSFRTALEDSNQLTRTFRFSAYLQDLTADELPDALEALEAQHLWLGDGELTMFMLAWGAIDPAAGFEYADRWPASLREMGRTAAFYSWAFYDPEGARAALDGLESRSERQGLVHQLVLGWSAGEHKQGLGDWIAAMPKGPGRQRYAGILARALLRENPEALMAWADSVPVDANDDFKPTAFLKAANILAHEDPLLARDWIEGQLENDYARRVAPVVVRRWAQDDAQAALAWSRTLADEEDRERSAANAFREWLNSEPKEAKDWLRANTPAPDLDSALRIVVQQTTPKSMKRAMGWAERTFDPERRERAIADLAARWQRQDPEGMNAWLAQAEISDETRKRIAEAPEPKRAPPSAGRRPHRRPRPGSELAPGP